LSAYSNWENFLDQTAGAMRQTSLRSIYVINRKVRHVSGGRVEHQLKDEVMNYTFEELKEFGGIKDRHGADLVDPEAMQRYFEALPEALGFFQGWESLPGENPHRVDGRLWVPTSALVRSDIEGTLNEFLAAAQRQEGPVFVSGHVNCYDAAMDDIIQVADRLRQKGFEVVRPDVFLRLGQDACRRGWVELQTTA
jgi:hypothetical protein